MSERQAYDPNQTTNPNSKSLKRKVLEATAGTLATAAAVTGVGMGVKSWHESRVAAYEAEMKAEKEAATAAMVTETRKSVRVVAEAIRAINPKKAGSRILDNYYEGHTSALLSAKHSYEGDGQIDVSAAVDFDTGMVTTNINKVFVTSVRSSKESLMAMFAVSPEKLNAVRKDGIVTAAELGSMVDADAKPIKIFYAFDSDRADPDNQELIRHVVQSPTGELVDSISKRPYENAGFLGGQIADLNEAIAKVTEEVQ